LSGGVGEGRKRSARWHPRPRSRRPIAVPDWSLFTRSRPETDSVKSNSERTDTRIFSPLAIAGLVSLSVAIGIYSSVTAVSAGRFYRFEHMCHIVLAKLWQSPIRQPPWTMKSKAPWYRGRQTRAART